MLFFVFRTLDHFDVIFFPLLLFQLRVLRRRISVIIVVYYFFLFRKERNYFFVAISVIEVYFTLKIKSPKTRHNT